MSNFIGPQVEMLVLLLNGVP